METTYTRDFSVEWPDLDANFHMKNTAYLEYVARVRASFFSAHGFGLDQYASLSIGPAIYRDEITYRREFRLGGLSEDATRFRYVNRLWKANGEIGAVVTSLGACFDLKKRRITSPPESLRLAFQRLARTEDFEIMIPDKITARVSSSSPGG